MAHYIPVPHWMLRCTFRSCPHPAECADRGCEHHDMATGWIFLILFVSAVISPLTHIADNDGFAWKWEKSK